MKVMLPRFCLLFLLLITSLATSEKYAFLVCMNDYSNHISYYDSVCLTLDNYTKIEKEKEVILNDQKN